MHNTMTEMRIEQSSGFSCSRDAPSLLMCRRNLKTFLFRSSLRRWPAVDTAANTTFILPGYHHAYYVFAVCSNLCKKSSNPSNTKSRYLRNERMFYQSFLNTSTSDHL